MEVVQSNVSRSTPSVPRSLTLAVTLDDDDTAMVEAFISWKVCHPKRSPQRWEVIGYYQDRAGRRRSNGEKVFERLKLFGVIDHKRNGHCWLSESFKARLGGATSSSIV